jgi:hypothetical protein
LALEQRKRQGLVHNAVLEQEQVHNMEQVQEHSMVQVQVAERQ